MGVATLLWIAQLFLRPLLTTDLILMGITDIILADITILFILFMSLRLKTMESFDEYRPLLD
jgi:hypothetical protein